MSSRRRGASDDAGLGDLSVFQLCVGGHWKTSKKQSSSLILILAQAMTAHAMMPPDAPCLLETAPPCAAAMSLRPRVEGGERKISKSKLRRLRDRRVAIRQSIKHTSTFKEQLVPPFCLNAGGTQHHWQVDARVHHADVQWLEMKGYDPELAWLAGEPVSRCQAYY